MSKKAKRIQPLPMIAAVVVIAAAAVTLIPKASKAENTPMEPSPASSESTPKTDSGDLVIQSGKIGTEASFFDYDANGTTVQVFAVQASDGTIRLALNTCQICNGSPYAYFIQDGDMFICQNCMNRFASTEVGIAGSGCCPIPISENVITQEAGTIIIPSSFLDESAALFENWKKY